MRRAALALALGVAGCSLLDEAEPTLPGDRIPVRAAPPERVIAPERAAELAPLGAPRANADWPQPNATASRAPGHLAAPAELAEAWRADIGEGDDDGARITAQPVVADGAVYALDAAASVAALDAATGAQRWRVSVAPEGEDGDEGFGGGLAVAGGRVFVSTGFGEVVALAPGDGAELWRRSLGAPVRSAPAVADGLVIAITRDDQAFALDAASGAVVWRAAGAAGGAGFLGGASPAIGGGLAVLPFSSGELLAVAAATGRRIWSDSVIGAGDAAAGAGVSDIAGDPVIAGGAVFAAALEGRLAALDARSGRRGWSRAVGSASPVWVAGATLFVATSDGRLMRLAGATGETMWSETLPLYDDPEDREGRIAYFGPVVAGGRVLLASARDGLLAFDAQSGERRGEHELPGGAASAPAVAGGAVYAIGRDGVLVAFR